MTDDEWDAHRVRALRSALGASQRALADRLGTRQQTVSEWERGASRPRRMARRLLGMLAEEHGVYTATAEGGDAPAQAEAQSDPSPASPDGGGAR